MLHLHLQERSLLQTVNKTVAVERIVQYLSPSDDQLDLLEDHHRHQELPKNRKRKEGEEIGKGREGEERGGVNDAFTDCDKSRTILVKSASPTPTITMERGREEALTILSTVFCMSVISPSYDGSGVYDNYHRLIIIIIISTLTNTTISPINHLLNYNISTLPLIPFLWYI